LRTGQSPAFGGVNPPEGGGISQENHRPAGVSQDRCRRLQYQQNDLRSPKAKVRRDLGLNRIIEKLREVRVSCDRPSSYEWALLDLNQ
jgi:hypothetical protein